MSNRIFKINLFKSKLSNIPIKPKKISRLNYNHLLYNKQYTI